MLTYSRALGSRLLGSVNSSIASAKTAPGPSKQKGKQKLSEPTPQSTSTMAASGSGTGLKLIIKKWPQNEGNDIYLIFICLLTPIIDSDDTADKDYQPPAKSPPPEISTDDEIVHVDKKQKTGVCEIYYLYLSIL